MPADNSALYEIRGLEVELGSRLVLGPLDLEIKQGTFLGMLGPNGSGKTTLLRTIAGGIKPKTGSLTFEGRSIDSYRAAELARRAGVVPQQFQLDFNFTVGEMVAMGRYAHSARGRTDVSAADGEAVAAALAATGMTAMAERPITELSGGEKQRALIAQTLAQQTPTLLLDEPLNNLDLNHQLETMQLLRSLNREGRTIIVVVHDLNMAAQYCDELLLLRDGCQAARGTPAEVINPQTVLEVFGVRVVVHREGSRPYMTPLWSGMRHLQSDGQARRVHVIAGGDAASGILHELVSRGHAPTVGIVSVFDTDYSTAQRYELEVVSAPPFQAFPVEALEEHERLSIEAEVIVVAPIFFGPGNLTVMQAVLDAARAGKKVIVVDGAQIAERDMSNGAATQLFAELASLGAAPAEDVRQLLDLLT